MSFAEIDQNSLCVFVEKQGDGSNRALGTGCFFMRRDLVLTAKHVLEDVVREQRQVFIANGSKEGRLFGAKPERFFAHPRVDLALVQVSVDDLVIDHPLFPAHFPLNRSSGAIAFGYDKSRSSNSANSWAVSAQKVVSFESEERERTGGEIEYSLHFEAAWMAPGFSGGPVLALGGGVVAVLTEQFAIVSASDEAVSRSRGRATAVYPMLEFFKSPFEWMKRT